LKCILSKNLWKKEEEAREGKEKSDDRDRGESTDGQKKRKRRVSPGSKTLGRERKTEDTAHLTLLRMKHLRRAYERNGKRVEERKNCDQGYRASVPDP